MTIWSARASFVRPIFFIALLLCCTASAIAQAGRGGINGLITDSTGAIISGATVIAQNEGTRVKVSTVSTAAGLYSFVSLAPAIYDVTASAKGFETTVRKGITVSVDQTSAANISLSSRWAMSARW